MLFILMVSLHSSHLWSEKELWGTFYNARSRYHNFFDRSNTFLTATIFCFSFWEVGWGDATSAVDCVLGPSYIYLLLTWVHLLYLTTLFLNPRFSVFSLSSSHSSISTTFLSRESFLITSLHHLSVQSWIPESLPPTLPPIMSFLLGKFVLYTNSRQRLWLPSHEFGFY